jgi:hypothetical protein
LERFGNTTNAYIADRIAKDCLILPSSVANLEVVAKMAELAVTTGTNESALAWFQMCRGLAEYRQRHFPQAVEWEQKSLVSTSSDLNLEAYASLAMAEYQLGEFGLARAALAKGNEIADSKLPKVESGDVGDNWSDWIIAHALLREASGMIAPDRSLNPDSKTQE